MEGSGKGGRLAGPDANLTCHRRAGRVRDACPAGTTRPVAEGLLTAQCLARGRYLYTALRPGTATVIATVRPRCAPGSMCPQWITEPRLAVAIS
jgi:hypothetical protein